MLQRRSCVRAIQMGLVCLTLVTTGCVHRALTIRTDPPGAQVYLNDKLVGVSPTTLDFEWYGWYRVILRKDGYARLDDHKLLRAPIYLWIPFDLLAELMPFTVRDTRTWSYTLIPSVDLPMPVPPAVGTVESPREPPATAPTLSPVGDEMIPEEPTNATR